MPGDPKNAKLTHYRFKRLKTSHKTPIIGADARSMRSKISPKMWLDG